jgi:putative NADPH-quinone reductase
MNVLVVYAHPNPEVQIDPATREVYLQKAYSLGLEF